MTKLGICCHHFVIVSPHVFSQFRVVKSQNALTVVQVVWHERLKIAERKE